MPDLNRRPDTDPCTCRQCRHWYRKAIYVDGVEVGGCYNMQEPFRVMKEVETCRYWQPRLVVNK